MATSSDPSATAGLAAHSQVAGLVRSFLRRPDGTYQVSLRLAPDHLGSVRVELELRGTEVSLRLNAESVAGRDALISGTTRLRAELAAGGLSATVIDVITNEQGHSGGRSLGQSSTPGQSGLPGQFGNPDGRRSHGLTHADDHRATAPEGGPAADPVSNAGRSLNVRL